MKRLTNYILGFALAFILGSAVLVSAQNINKALQLSQDPTGAIGVDTNNNVYFPAHVLTQQSAAPTLGSGLVSASITGSDWFFQLVGVTASSAGSVTFRQAYLLPPACIIQSQNPATSPVAFNVAVTGINITTFTGAVSATGICSGLR